MIEFGKSGVDYVIVNHAQGVQIILNREELKDLTRFGMIELNVIDGLLNTGNFIFDKDRRFKDALIQRWGIIFIQELRRKYVRRKAGT